jgi:hypothetical protein
MDLAKPSRLSLAWIVFLQSKYDGKRSTVIAQLIRIPEADVPLTALIGTALRGPCHCAGARHAQRDLRGVVKIAT